MGIKRTAHAMLTLISSITETCKQHDRECDRCREAICYLNPNLPEILLASCIQQPRFLQNLLVELYKTNRKFYVVLFAVTCYTDMNDRHGISNKVAKVLGNDLNVMMQIKIALFLSKTSKNYEFKIRRKQESITDHALASIG